MNKENTFRLPAHVSNEVPDDADMATGDGTLAGIVGPIDGDDGRRGPDQDPDFGVPKPTPGGAAEIPYAAKYVGPKRGIPC